MEIKLGRVVLLVEDYDAAFTFYEKNFFCKILFDETTSDGQRFLHIGFPAADGAGIWFLKPDSQDQKAKVGKQTAGQPIFVLYTNEIKNLYNHLKQNGVRVIDELVFTPKSSYFHCLDLYGNRLTIVQLHK